MFINFDLIFIGLITYLIGSVPFGLLVSKLAKQDDPRMVGSKNIGATNIMRIGGWKLGFLTLILDVTKGFIPIYLINIYNKEEFLGIAILSIILGHLYPIWLKFSGGKGYSSAILGTKTSTIYVCGQRNYQENLQRMHNEPSSRIERAADREIRVLSSSW